jgi:Leucine Rich repeat
MVAAVAHPHAEKILSLILHEDRDVALQGVELARSLDDPDHLEAIAGSSFIDPARGTLVVWHPLSRIVDEGLRALIALRFVLDLVVHARRPPPPTTLDLAYLNLGPELAPMLADTPALSSLTTLDLRHNGLDDAAVVTLAGARHFTSLTTLRLQRNAIGAEGVAALADSDLLRHVTTLDLRHNPIGPEGALALARSEHLRHITWLGLYLPDVTREGALALVRSEHLRRDQRAIWKARLEAPPLEPPP